MPRERVSLPAVDYIKSAAIAAVLVQHSIPAFLDRPLTPSETMIFGTLSFHVPAFLFLSGFLSHAESTVPWREVYARLWRIVPPYLVATAIASVHGVVAFPTLRRLIFATVTGGALGHYYFVPVLVFCVLLLPAFSHMSTPFLIGGTVLLLIAGEYMTITPEWRLGYPMFWQIRNPILQFHLGFFLLGVIAARLRTTLGDLGTRFRSMTIGIAGVCVALLAGLAHANEVIFRPTVHAAYTISVMALIAASVPRKPAPRSIRFLSEATFTIYLYHWFAYAAVLQLMPQEIPLLLRIPILISAGLAFSTMIVLVGRRTLGPRSRLLVGT